MPEPAHFCPECGARLTRVGEACWLCHRPAAASVSLAASGPAPAQLRNLQFRRTLALIAMVLVGVIGLPIAGFIALFAVCIAALSSGGPSSWAFSQSDWLYLALGLFVAVVCPLMIFFLLLFRIRRHDQSIRRLEGR